MADLVTKTHCNKNTKFMTDKLDKLGEKFINFELKVVKALAEMPKELADEFDQRYALKYVESEVSKIQNKNENRLFDYFKIAIEIIIALGLAYIGLIKL